MRTVFAQCAYWTAVPWPPAVASVMTPSISSVGPGLLAADPGQRNRGVRADAGAGRLLDGIDLRYQQRGAREVAAERGGLTARVVGGGEDLERPGVAGKLDRARADLEAAVVVPDQVRRPRGQETPPEHLLHGDLGTRERRNRAPQHGRGGGAPVGEDQRQAVQQQIARKRGIRRAWAPSPRRGRRRAGCRPHPPARRRTALRSTHRDTCRARGVRRAARASSRPGAAAAGRRCRGSGRTRPRPGADPRGLARTRRAVRPPRPPAAHEPHRTPQPPGWPGRRRGLCRLAGRDRPSAQPHAVETRPRPQSRHAPAPGPPNARARRRPPRQAPKPQQPDATHDDPGRRLDSSPPPTPSGPPGAPARRQIGTRLSAPRDGGRSRVLRVPAIRPSRRPRRARSRGVRKRAATAADRRPGRPLRRATDVARLRGGSRVVGRSSSRSVSRDRGPPACRTHRPAASVSTLGAARATRAGFLVSPRGSCRVLARPTRTASSSPAARGHHR